MRIRITGRRLPKAVLGLTTNSCPDGQVWDEETNKCVEGYWDPITHSIVRSEEISDADYWDAKENPFVNSPFFSNFSKAVGKRAENDKLGLSSDGWKTTGNEGLAQETEGDFYSKPTRREKIGKAFEKINKFIAPIDRGINEFKGAISNATLLANAINNKAYFTNDKSLNRFTNIYSQATSPIRLGNFDQEGNFDPRNMGAKSEGQFANPYYQKGTFPRLTAADGGELGNIMSYAAPIQSMTEIAPAPSSFGYFPRSSGQPTTSSSTSSASANSGSTAGSSSQFIFPVESIQGARN